MKLTESAFWGCLILVAYPYCLCPALLLLVYPLVQTLRDLRYFATRDDRRLNTDSVTIRAEKISHDFCVTA